MLLKTHPRTAQLDFAVVHGRREERGNQRCCRRRRRRLRARGPPSSVFPGLPGRRASGKTAWEGGHTRSQRGVLAAASVPISTIVDPTRRPRTGDSFRPRPRELHRPKSDTRGGFLSRSTNAGGELSLCLLRRPMGPRRSKRRRRQPAAGWSLQTASRNDRTVEVSVVIRRLLVIHDAKLFEGLDAGEPVQPDVSKLSTPFPSGGAF